jgi:cell division transport system permease protein
MDLSRNSDFNFSGDKSNKFIPFIIGFLMYSATIAVMSCFFTHSLTSEWSNALNGHMTIEFQANVIGAEEALTEKQKEEVIKVLQSTAGIKSAKLLCETEILKILEPWLSSTSIPDDFPFPTIFDVEAQKNEKIDLLLLTEKLSKISQGAKIHDHANWYAPIVKISNGLFFFAILLSVLIFITVCATVVFITKKTLNTHEDIVKILQLIGANNSYIADQFKKYYFSIGCRASLLSILFSILTVSGIIFISSSGIGIAALKYIIIFLIIPIVTTILVMVTSKNSVVFFLNNDKWIG